MLFLRLNHRELGERIELFRKTVSGIMLTLLLTGMLTLAFNLQPVKAEPTTIYVDDDNTSGPWDGTPEYPYQNITSGLEHAVDGDIIFVYNGTYYEHLIVSKSVALVGEDRSITIIYGNGEGEGVEIITDRVNMTGFTVQNFGYYLGEYGVRLSNANNCNITGNNIVDNDSGIKLLSSYNNTVSENNITANENNGISIDSSSNNAIFGNELAHHPTGISIKDSSFNTVSGNNVTSCGLGIDVWGYSAYTSNNIVCANYLVDSSLGLLGYASNNIFCENNIIGATYGFWIKGGASNNIFYGNNVTSGKMTSVYIQDSNCNGNKFYHNNFIDNRRTDVRGINIWDDNYPSGGNYWSDYNGTDLFNGPNQNETGSDGIGDTPYVLNATNQDNYPLTKPYPWALHDIGITSVTTSREVVGQGCNVSINVMIFNYGNDTETFNVTILANSTIIGKINNINLQSRNFTILSHTWNTTGFAIGNYTMKAVADIVTNETYTTDNTYINGIVTVRLPIYDVAVIDVIHSKTGCLPMPTVGQNYNVSIYVKVENEGDFEETFNLTTYVNTTAIRELQVTLTPGENKTLIFTWNTSGFAKGNYTIWAYAWPVLGETYTEDNTLTDGWVIVTIPGDVNGDHLADISDLVITVGVIPSAPGWPNWNPNADINGDGVCDISDLVICVGTIPSGPW
jgi:parallel beta-helix repeat protein